jgi:hypothetical protein
LRHCGLDFLHWGFSGGFGSARLSRQGLQAPRFFGLCQSAHAWGFVFRRIRDAPAHGDNTLHCFRGKRGSHFQINGTHDECHHQCRQHRNHQMVDQFAHRNGRIALAFNGTNQARQYLVADTGGHNLSKRCLSTPTMRRHTPIQYPVEFA